MTLTHAARHADYAEFDVPGKPKEQDGICFYIYFNIFFSGKGDGRMNQFVPQLMLGNSLTASSGPPDYKPKWVQHKEWTFSSQYFMEINNTKTGNPAEGHAATGEAYAAKEGEKVWTKFTLSADHVWTLGMGVVGDASRTSTVVADKPFMGLVRAPPPPLAPISLVWPGREARARCVLWRSAARGVLRACCGRYAR